MVYNNLVFLPRLEADALLEDAKGAAADTDELWFLSAAAIARAASTPAGAST